MNHQAMIFDLGGVLVDWDPRYLLAPLIGDPERLEQFLEHVLTREFLLEVDAGRPLGETAAAWSARHPQWERELAAFAQRWPETVRGAIPGTEAVLRELAGAGAPLYAISNWPADTFWVARERFAVLEVFADIVVSGQVGLVKPDPRIYALALERFGRTAAECAFVDDRPVNVDAAQAMGLTGIRFTTADDLRAHPVVAAWLG